MILLNKRLIFTISEKYKLNRYPIFLNYKVIFLIVLLFFSNFDLIAQEKESFYLKKIQQFTSSNNDSLLYYSNKLKRSTDICNRIKALNFEAKAYYQMSNVNKAESILKNVLKEINDNNSDLVCLKMNHLNTLNKLFWIYKNKRSYQKAYDVAIERKKISESIENKNYYNAINNSINNNIAIIKDLMGFHEEARNILKNNYKSLPDIYNKLIEQNYFKDDIKKAGYYLTLNQTSTLNLIGESFLQSSDNYKSIYLDSASYYFKESFKIAKNFAPPHKDTETVYQLREAEVLIAKHQYKKSLELINQYSKNSKEYNTYQKINSLKAICFQNLEEKDSAVKYSRKFLNNFKKQRNNKERLIAIYNILSNYYFQTEQIDSARKYSELTISELNLFNKNKTYVNKAHYLYNYNDINKLNEKILTNKRNKNLWFLTLAVFLIVILSYLFFNYKKKIKESSLNKIEQDIINEKKDYNIDKITEDTILQGIIEFKNSKGFLDKNFTINVLAKKLGTNTSYLSYIFNQNYNQSFKQFITKLRIDYLIIILNEDTKYKNYTIKALAEEIGYTNASAFSRAFKKYMGINPSDYIKSLN
ncbi:helix-turn-helix domain-containing protein [Polaribacter marinivivus]|uniref:Helix-turn-helix domain-containing protein n=1 Tax=Polaribacter marinivivus TaxID=1524260 RepID=A0ABV8RBX0_9FLAO